MRVRRFNAKTEHIARKNLVVPGTLSRSQMRNSEGITTEELFVNLIETTRPVSDAKIQKTKQESLKGPKLQNAMRSTRHGWPDRGQAVPGTVKDYFDARSQLSVSSDMLLYRDCRDRIVILVALRSEMMD